MVQTVWMQQQPMTVVKTMTQCSVMYMSVQSFYMTFPSTLRRYHRQMFYAEHGQGLNGLNSSVAL